MGTELERDLGLVAVVAICMGAMIGSGIFILPGLAMASTGPAVVVAFAVASLLVVPAALSIAELGTAMPEAGGDYVFIREGMGPLVGTIAGLGTWFTLVFKGSLALVGGIPYLLLVTSVPETASALLLALALVVVNLVGVKATGKIQVVLVAAMLAILTGVVVTGAPRIDGSAFDPLFADGTDGFVAAVGLVVVAYAGITKVASVAEEVVDPGRTLPLGIGIALGVTTVIYVALTFVVVGVGGDALSGSLTPIADAVEPGLGSAGVAVVVAAAMFALISTANAGLLTASRYPLALARDDLVPETFARVSDRFDTPHVAVLATGTAMLFIIAVVPILEIAKLASAFQILVYVLVCLALIAFRERNPVWYEPAFTLPLYPWIPVGGVAAGVLVLTQMGAVPMVGALAIVVSGGLWFRVYGRHRSDDDALAAQAARDVATDHSVSKVESAVASADGTTVLVAVRGDVTGPVLESLVRVGGDVADARDGTLHVARLSPVPAQQPLGTAADTDFEGGIEEADVFASLVEEVVADVGVASPVEAVDVVCHDPQRATVNRADRLDADLLVTGANRGGRFRRFLGSDADYVKEHAPCDVALVQPGEFGGTHEIAVVTDESPYHDPLKVQLGAALADEADATLRLCFATGPDTPDAEFEAIGTYHARLDDAVPVRVESTVVRTDDAVAGLADTVATADAVLVGAGAYGRFHEFLLPSDERRLAESIEQPAILLRARGATRTTFLAPLIDRILYRHDPDE